MCLGSCRNAPDLSTLAGETPEAEEGGDFLGIDLSHSASHLRHNPEKSVYCQPVDCGQYLLTAGLNLFDRGIDVQPGVAKQFARDQLALEDFVRQISAFGGFGAVGRLSCHRFGFCVGGQR